MNNPVEILVPVVKKLNDNVLSNISFLNCGGCGHFSKMAYYSLKGKGLDPKIVVVCSTPIESKKAWLKAYQDGEEVSEYQLNDTSFYHCYIEVDGFCFDGEEFGEEFVSKWDNRTRQKGYYTIEELELALKVGGWNSMFRTSQLPKLEKIIYSTFAEIEL